MIFQHPFKLLTKKKFDRFDKKALYLWDLVFADDPEYQKLRKKIKVQPKKIKLTHQFLKIKEKLEKNENLEIWKELGKRCIECGQCSMVCPTCFCFSFKHDSSKKTKRTMGTCFNHDFSEIAGGHKFLNRASQRIYFWYYHKFVRIPLEYNLPGCVKCRHCAKVCPVGIDIRKVIKKILMKN